MVAILGFGINCSENNLRIAQHVAGILSMHQLSILCGGTGGTFHAAFETNHMNGGKNIAFLEEGRTIPCEAILSEVRYFTSSQKKHKAMVDASVFAIAIGGGPGTISIAEKILLANKPLYIVKGTEGIALAPPDGSVLITEEELSAVIEKEVSKLSR